MTMTADVQWPTFGPEDGPLETIVKLSRYYGRTPGYVVAGGGNTSVKVGDRLYVKASGHALAEIGPEGFVALDRSRLSAILQMEFSDDVAERERVFTREIMSSRLDTVHGPRPSVESVLHNLMPGQYTVHTHATNVNVLTCCTQGKALADKWFGDDVLWVPYVDPGITLAKTISKAMTDYGAQPPTAVLMENHGMFVFGDTPEEVRDRTSRVMDEIARRLADVDMMGAFGEVKEPAADTRAQVETLGPILRALLADGQALKAVTFDNSPTAMNVAAAADGQSVASINPLGPDHIVYAGSLPLWLDAVDVENTDEAIAQVRKAVDAYRAEHGWPPKVVLVAGLGLFAAGDDWKTANTARNMYLNSLTVMALARRLGGIQGMTDQQRRFIEGWEAESYRSRVSGGGPAGRVGGKVAVITGGAQGFGLGIAEQFVAAGGHAVLADINVDAARTAAETLCEKFGPGRAIGAAMDITNGQAICDGLYETIATYGGFDVFIANAGVLRAGSVKTQSEADFDLVTAVNYKGYFLCVQNCSRVMALQHAAKPEYRSDIVQINSKSGLVGSNRNSAYAGSKFGTIGLTQSFALELWGDGIKVNSICPGNFFDGPLWSDPDNGLFVQYLQTGKVPGAKTIEDVRKAYEAKVPMGRGCEPEDVARAIFYLIDQQYETGQALPVTGGQVMLK